MEFSKIMVFLMFMVAAFGIAMSTEIEVDWTVGKNYKEWAHKNNFYVGDTLVFQYIAQYHNVYQVNKKDYQSCSSTSPMASYSSGRDSIALTTPGSYYFICGFPGHCESGQKLKIKVQKGDKHGGDTTPCPPGPDTAQGYPRHSSSPHSSANWLTAISTTFVGIFVASYFCGVSL